MKYLQIKIYVIQELHKNSGRAWIPLQNAVLRALEFQIKHIHSWCCWLYLGSSLAYFLAVFTCFHSQCKWIDIYFLANIQEVGNSNPRHISILYPTRMFPFTDHMALSTVFLANRPGRKLHTSVSFQPSSCSPLAPEKCSDLCYSEVPEMNHQYWMKTVFFLTASHSYLSTVFTPTACSSVWV